MALKTIETEMLDVKKTHKSIGKALADLRETVMRMGDRLEAAQLIPETDSLIVAYQEIDPQKKGASKILLDLKTKIDVFKSKVEGLKTSQSANPVIEALNSEMKNLEKGLKSEKKSDKIAEINSKKAQILEHYEKIKANLNANKPWEDGLTAEEKQFVQDIFSKNLDPIFGKHLLEMKNLDLANASDFFKDLYEKNLMDYTTYLKFREQVLRHYEAVYNSGFKILEKAYAGIYLQNILPQGVGYYSDTHLEKITSAKEKAGKAVLEFKRDLEEFAKENKLPASGQVGDADYAELLKLAKKHFGQHAKQMIENLYKIKDNGIVNYLRNFYLAEPNPAYLDDFISLRQGVMEYLTRLETAVNAKRWGVTEYLSKPIISLDALGESPFPLESLETLENQFGSKFAEIYHTLRNWAEGQGYSSDILYRYPEIEKLLSRNFDELPSHEQAVVREFLGSCEYAARFMDYAKKKVLLSKLGKNILKDHTFSNETRDLLNKGELSNEQFVERVAKETYLRNLRNNGFKISDKLAKEFMEGIGNDEFAIRLERENIAKGFEKRIPKLFAEFVESERSLTRLIENSPEFRGLNIADMTQLAEVLEFSDKGFPKTYPNIWAAKRFLMNYLGIGFAGSIETPGSKNIEGYRRFFFAMDEMLRGRARPDTRGEPLGAARYYGLRGLGLLAAAELAGIGIISAITTEDYADAKEKYDEAKKTFDELIGFLTSEYNVKGFSSLIPALEKDNAKLADKLVEINALLLISNDNLSEKSGRTAGRSNQYAYDKAEEVLRLIKGIEFPYLFPAKIDSPKNQEATPEEKTVKTEPIAVSQPKEIETSIQSVIDKINQIFSSSEDTTFKKTCTAKLEEFIKLDLNDANNSKYKILPSNVKAPLEYTALDTIVIRAPSEYKDTVKWTIYESDKSGGNFKGFSEKLDTLLDIIGQVNASSPDTSLSIYEIEIKNFSGNLEYDKRAKLQEALGKFKDITAAKNISPMFERGELGEFFKDKPKTKHWVFNNLDLNKIRSRSAEMLSILNEYEYSDNDVGLFSKDNFKDLAKR